MTEVQTSNSISPKPSLRSVLVDLLSNVPEGSRPARFDEIMEMFGAPEVISGILGLGQTRIGDVARAVNGARCLRVRRKKVASIGLFVGRLRGGGAERVVSLLAGILSERGKRIVLFTQEPPHPMDFPVPGGIERIVLPTAARDWGRRVETLQRELSRHDIDVYIHNAEKTPLLLYDLLAVKSAGVYFLSYNHGCFAGLFTENSICVRPSIDVQRLADMSPVLSRDFEACYRALGVRAVTVANPLSLEIVDRPPEKPDDDLILWVARRNAIKHYLAPVRILSEVVKRRPKARVLMVGEPQDRNCDRAIVRLAKRLGVRARIRLSPYTEDIRPLYRRASVVLVSSVCEASPMVLLEAMASGVPVVMYDLPYVESAKGCNAVFQVPFDSSIAAAASIGELLENAGKWRGASLAGIARAKTLSEADVGAMWDKLFADLLEGKDSPAGLAAGSWFGRELLSLLDAQAAGAAIGESKRREYLETFDATLVRPAFRQDRSLVRVLANVLDWCAWRVRQLSDFGERRLLRGLGLSQTVREPANSSKGKRP